MTSPTVIFDLDGTLLSTSADLMASLNHVLAHSGVAPVHYQDMTWLVGQGARVMIERAHVLRGHPAGESELAGLMDMFIAHYGANMPGETVPFPGILAALDRLEADGMRLAVCTNKTESLAVKLLEGLGMAGRFAAITGGDTFAIRKPHGDHILRTIEMAGGSPRHAVMIGDSVNDILAGQNANVPTIAVPFGYSDRPVEEFNPTVVIRHFDELDAGLIHRLIAAVDA
ncbi:phosphoglycolate phosphatase [Hoeflea marina]|uniref:Phosphoglycolate phosphatase n=1 Tax=Hoeflea marina TaxID=274592 RepID=A0A317PUV2_9HYPH|nr:HAD family hydrolase [Hoeflea marina]PWW04465.1 phosphoglycolate phosphatase [Hoeflea marina]